MSEMALRRVRLSVLIFVASFLSACGNFGGSGFCDPDIDYPPNHRCYSED